MATKPAAPSPLTGLAADLASLPQDPGLRGGWQEGFSGVTQSQLADGQPAEGEDFAGMGPLLEQPDADVFQIIEGLVIRQEWIAKNHLAQDSHWTLVKGGYPWSTLEKVPGKDQWQQSLPYGVSAVSIQAVPNKAWDLVNKATETLLVDFPKVECEPADDSESAESAAEMADRFLEEDATEQGTNDAILFNDRVNRALTTATTYVEGWVDPTGGGYVPLQIKAHPQAESPEKPLVGPDGMPTTDYVLRYVGQGQFVTNPAEADPQWQPRIRATKWGREHLCVYPESATVDTCEKLIIKGFCTLSEGKKRWPEIAEMTDDERASLCDWTPQRYLVLLPPFQRARWKLTDARDKDKGSSADERIFFYYHLIQRATPDYPKGADVVVTGALNSRIIHRELLASDVETEKQGQTVTESRCREIPVVQITPVGDPDEQDPTGRSFLELFAGAVENSAHLAMSASDLIDHILHVERFIPATSPVSDEDVANSRATGQFITLQRPGDQPIYGTPPQFPPAFFNFYELADEAINSISAQERAASGSEDSKERSGKALQIAIGRNNVANTGKQHAVMNAYTRWCRIKLELAMAYFTTPQMIRYIGEDGAFKQEEFNGTDFALVGKVNIKAGTGTMHSPDEKVQYLGNLTMAGMLDSAEAKDAARPQFAKSLGIADNPHEQYVERCIDMWLEGPPEPQPGEIPWAQQYTAWKQAKDQHDQLTAQYTEQMQQYQQAEQLAMTVAGGASDPAAAGQVNQAMVALRLNPYGAAFMGLIPPPPAIEQEEDVAPEPPAPEPAEPPHVAVDRTMGHLKEIMASMKPEPQQPAPITMHIAPQSSKKRSKIRKNDDGTFEVETETGNGEAA